MTRSKLIPTIVASVAVGAVGAGLATSQAATNARGSSATGASAQAGASAATALQNDYVSVYRRLAPSVVQIQTSSGLGSGIVFDSKGDIVTNDHVVGDPPATSFTVTTQTGRQLKGKLVGVFVADDLAVIKVDASGLTPASFADSGKLQVGDIAIAIGNPLGLASSVTEGIVSGLGRNEPEGDGVVLQNAIQTSAAINPGNSGGALADLGAQVIGIPTLAATDPELGGAASGIGFAIPSDTVTDIARQLIQYGKVVSSGRAYIGVDIADTGEENGVYVSSVVAGTPAAKAGLKAGDLIVGVDGTQTPDSSTLGTALAAFKPGQSVTIKYDTQSGATKSVTLTLAQLPGSAT